MTEAEFRCAAVVVVQRVDLARLAAFATEEFDPWNPPAELYELWIEWDFAMEEGFQRCVDDTAYLAAPYVFRSAFSEETIECVRNEVGDPPPLFDLSSGSGTLSDLESYYVDIDLLTLIVDEALETCYLPSEQELFDDVYQRLDEIYSDSFEGEPDSLAT